MNGHGFSLLKKCCICLLTPKRLLPLNEKEKRIAVKLFHRYRKLDDSKAITVCEWCFKNLYYMKQQLISLLARRNYVMNCIFKMSKEITQKQEEIHDIRCCCEECKMKNGDLPLLVQVIEQKSLPTHPEQQEEAIPSTSREESPRRKQMTCEHCQKVFTHRGDMNKHLRKHTKEQPFECPVCRRKFAHTSNLQRHLRNHTGERPFVCRTCGKAFSRKDKLELHKRSRSCRQATAQM